jgi:hypothetical protein
MKDGEDGEVDFERQPSGIENAYSSAEKFKENEKHLSEGRLRNESKIDIPIPSIKDFNKETKSYSRMS